MVTALLEIKPSLMKVKGANNLKKLRVVMKNFVFLKEEKQLRAA